jgi:ribosomal protein S18 acetylase RimI-like enzyme
VIFIILRQNFSVLGYLPSIGNSLPLANRGSKACFNFAAACDPRLVARRMCEHSLAYARSRGYRAMQFNFVVSTNERAVRLWQSLDFKVVGRLPLASATPLKAMLTHW